MNLSSLTEILRRGNADARAGALTALRLPEVLQLEGPLLAIAVVDSSAQVRAVVKTLLTERPQERRDALPLPTGHLSQERQRALVHEHAGQPGFVETLLVYERGRDLLSDLSLEVHAVDDLLLELAERAVPEVLEEMLALPLDLRGRAVNLLDRIDRFSDPARKVVLDALVRGALLGGRITDGAQLARARAAVSLWVDGLLQAPAGAPTFAEFLEAGGSLGRSVVTRAVEAPPAPATIEALSGLTRCLYLLLGPPSRETLLDRTPFAGDLTDPLAELRVAAWRLLLENELASPDEILEAAAKEQAPGAIVELLRSLGAAPLPPRLTGPVCAFLDDPRASVRGSVSGLLASNPLSAALASASIDPRASDAPLAILAAQPPALASPALVAYLEVERTPSQAVLAFDTLSVPPAPSWDGWQGWLTHPHAGVRHAAAKALLRLPASDAPAVAAFLPDLLADSPLQALRVIERFALPDTEREIAGVLFDEAVDEATARLAIQLMAGRGDWTAWVVLWRFVVGDVKPRRRYGNRSTRRAALDLLVTFPQEAGWTYAQTPPLPEGIELPPWLELRGRQSFPSSGALHQLLDDRDGSQAALALRYLGRRWGHPADDPSYVLERRVEDITRVVLGSLLVGERYRRFSAFLTRLLRRVVPRSWCAPPHPHRGRRGREQLAAAAIEYALRRGSRALSPYHAHLLLEHASEAVRGAAVRLYVSLVQTPLRDLAAHANAAVAEEAIRAAHPDQVEALVLERLTQVLRAQRATQLEGTIAWIEQRPSAAYVPLLEQLLARRGRGARRELVVRGLRAIHATAAGRAPVHATLRQELSETAVRFEGGRLRGALDLIEPFDAWDLVPCLLPALAWAGETTRRRLQETIRAYLERGLPLAAGDFAALLQHHLSEVQVFALSTLRKTKPARLWELLRPHGPGVRQRSTDFSKLFLGACEEHYEASMGLTLERLLLHPNGEVARRALKLLNRRERELCSVTLFERLDDPELRQPITTTFSTWSRRFVDPSLADQPELLEDERRQIRALITLLVEAPRARVLQALPEAKQSPVVFVRAAALFGIGRCVIDEERAWVAEMLDVPDPVLQRAAAAAAGWLGPDEALDRILRRRATAKEAELRATARQALVRRSDDATELEGLLTDSNPEVVLAVLDACRRRPEALGMVTLEARLGDRDPRVREALLHALALKTQGNALALRGPLRDAIADVRLAALEVVKSWNVTDVVRHEVGECVADASIHVSGAALDLLAAQEAVHA